MAASKPVVLPGADINKEIECRICMEQKTLRILTCGHKCCQECIGKCVPIGDFVCLLRMQQPRQRKENSKQNIASKPSLNFQTLGSLPVVLPFDKFILARSLVLFAISDQ